MSATIKAFREKSFRKFTFASGDLITSVPPVKIPFKNIFSSSKQFSYKPASKKQTQRQMPIKYRSCEKIKRFQVSGKRDVQQTNNQCKVIISSKSLSSTNHDDEIQNDQKRCIQAEEYDNYLPKLTLEKKQTAASDISQSLKSQSNITAFNYSSAKLSPCKFLDKIKANETKRLSRLQGKRKQYKILKINGKVEVFQILKYIDSGSFGDVFLVRHMLTNMIYCLKSIYRNRLNDKLRNQLIQEIKIQSFLNHSNIIKLYSFTSDSSFIYLLLQASLGDNLYKITKQKPMNQSIVSSIMKQICETVDYLHSKNIMHRDIKSENVLLDYGTVKLCDFGWAVHSPLLRNTISGTPVYTPPQIIKMEQYSNKVDTWCIGVLAYELLFEKLPFQIRYQKDFMKITNEEINFPNNKYISSTAKQFVQGCLNKNPKQRWSMKQALKQNFILQKGTQSKVK